MREQEVRARVHDALGEPPAAAAAAQRLEAGLYEAPRRADGQLGMLGQPRVAAAVAAALTLLVLGGLLALRAAQHQRPATSPATVGAPLAAAPGCLASAPAKLIVVHLATQQLVAYQDGCPFLSAPVTTGRSPLATPVGTFAIRATAPTKMLVSPWPKGSPYWYPAIVVHDFMAFGPDGQSLHSAEWEPAIDFGTGSQDGAFGTHGDVNVQSGPLGRLYAWASVGTTVVVEP
jgi:hypothetical protein